MTGATASCASGCPAPRPPASCGSRPGGATTSGKLWPQDGLETTTCRKLCRSWGLGELVAAVQREDDRAAGRHVQAHRAVADPYPVGPLRVEVAGAVDHRTLHRH